ncbi:Putative myc-type, basic helix-loop-helix (bHLH) domain-containing protein [Septoria linicola]|uniref:Myc-type, basic helix-loop-helix (BHLH) domain-containing protein n=1 Tax=Septoria linicola TaxID=215465 RepID=A0A9Q9EH49_9PEZI|nr:Putative myc-type, basic helix-loop-helix (bHLH) domain-containing protein [Septoria linicola]
MSEGANEIWRRQYVQDQMSLNHWHHNHALPVGSVHDTDFRMFHQESREYEDNINHEGGPLILPPMGYVPETSWGSDMDMGTPSTAGFPTSEPLDTYHPVRHSNIPHHLNLPPRHGRVQSSAQSPRSSYGEPVSAKEERPNLIRSITAPAAPDHRPRRVTNASGTSSIKRSGSEEEDDEYVPTEDAKPRGRKRQRIPHTAVERRYRENLNAHLEKLRQTVPSLASKRSAGASKPGDGLGEGVKPSKCEILNGAIEHIGALGKENAALKNEVNALRSRMEDLERWCNSGAFVK